MRAGSARKNPYDGIIQSIGKCSRRRKGNSVQRCSKSKGAKKAREQFQSQVIDGEPEIQWNYQEPSSPRHKHSSDPRYENVAEVRARGVELNGDNAAVGVFNNTMRKANQGVVSSKGKGPTTNCEGYIVRGNGNIEKSGYGSDCSEEGEQRRPVGWYLRNTKAERTELSQSDEDQMMQLSQESIARERAQVERPFGPATSDMDGIQPKRRKQQTSEIRKRPRSAPCPNLLARDNFEFWQPESESSLEENYAAEPRTKRTKEADEKTGAFRVPDGQEDRRYLEVLRDAKGDRASNTSLEEDDVMEENEPQSGNRIEEHISSPQHLKKIVITVRCKCPSKCKHKTSQPKRNRRFGESLRIDRRNPQVSSSETPVQQDTRNGTLESGTNYARVKNLGEGVLEKIRATAGNRMHVDGLSQGEVESLNGQALNSNSDGSRPWEFPLPAGEDGYSLSGEGVHIGLQVRQQLLGHSKGTRNDLPLHTLEPKYSMSQDTAASSATQEGRDFEPTYEVSSGDRRRSSPGETRVAQSTGQVTDMKPNLQGAPAEKQSLLSPSQTKRERRRITKEWNLKKILSEEHIIAMQKGSRRKEESAGSENVTHTSVLQTPIKPNSPGHQAKKSGKKNRKKVRDAHSGERRRQGKEEMDTSNLLDVPDSLDERVHGCVPHPIATGSEAESSKISNPEGSEIKNLGHQSLNHSEQPGISNTNEDGSARGADSLSPEPLIVRIDQFLVTDDENRRDDIRSPVREKANIPQQHEDVLQKEVLTKPELDECVVDVDNWEVQAEKVKALPTKEKAKGENLDELVDQKELNKQSKLLVRRSRRLRKSRMEDARSETGTKALDELSDDEDSTDKTSRSTHFSSSRGRSGTVQAERVRREQTHPMMTRRGSSRYADTLRGGAIVIDLTDAADEGEAGTTSRAVEGDDDINESLKELQKLSLQDRAKAFHERPRCKYLTPLSNDEDRLAKHLFTRTKVDTRIVAIAEAGITLRGESFKRLRGTRWLDDEVLNAYVSLINSRNDAIFHELNEEHRSGIPRAYVFNTYFFTRLCSGSSGFDYPGVQGWTKRARVDILQKDIILVPINLGNHHWVLSGIDMEHQEILYLDSMHDPDTAKAVSKLKRWVFEELRSKHGEAVALQQDPSSWKEVKHSYRVRRIGVLPESLEHRQAKAGRMAKVPRQQDGGSCGVFTAKMADCLSLGIKVYFKQGDIPLIRRRMALDLFRGYVPL